jgi:hypothetical protein
MRFFNLIYTPILLLKVIGKREDPRSMAARSKEQWNSRTIR